MKAEVSVIVPVYRVEAYLHRCIASVLGQTLSNFELILIDDGSPDNCGAICDEYAVKDSRVVVVHQENCGVSAARNHGVRIATGEYVTFIDGDDWVAPEYLEILYSNARRCQAEISVCDTKWVEVYTASSTDFHNNCKGLGCREAIREYGMKSFNKFVLVAGKLIHREILCKHLFPEERCVSEDMSVVYRWYFAASRVADSDAQLYYYYQHPQSITHAPFDRHKLQCLQAREEMLDFLEWEGFADVYGVLLHEYLAQAAWQYEQFRDLLHDTDTAERIRENMRGHIRRNWKKHGITPKQDAYALNICWPRMMKNYWRSDRLGQLLREEGSRKTIVRAVNMIRNRSKQ